MRSRYLKIASVPEAFLDGDIEPAKQLMRIQMIKSGERIKFMQAGHHVSVFDIGQPADMHDEVRAATQCRELITRSFDITVCQP
jgi:hypothetical protein